MADPLSVQIATIPKNSREEIRAQLTEFKGTQFADFRVFAGDPGEQSERKPTRQGVAISFDRLPQFVRAVVAAEKEARALGLIGGQP